MAIDAANYSDESEYIESVPSQANAAQAEAHRMLQRRKSSVAQQQILQHQQNHQQHQQQQSGMISTPQVSASQCDSVPIFYQTTHTFA